MLPVPTAIVDSARSVEGTHSPATFADFYAGIGPTDSISSTSRWRGLNDAATVNDTNVSVDRKAGEIMLAPGAFVPAVAAGANALSTTLSFGARRTDRYNFKGTIGKIGGSSHEYVGTDYETILNDTGRFAPFNAVTTQIIDEIIVAGTFTGDTAMSVTVSIVSVSSGNQVGRARQFTPTASIARYALSGFKAGVVAGRQYQLVYSATPPLAMGVRAPAPGGVVDYYAHVQLYGYAPVDVTWRIPMGGGLYVATGGRPNFAVSGSFQRSFDVGTVPVDAGVLSVSDIVPPGTTMAIAVYYTDSPLVYAEVALTNWTLLSGASTSGMGLTAHRYWRLSVVMTSSPAGDLSPELLSLSIRYAPPPTILGTTAELSKTTLYNGLTLPLKLPLTWPTGSRLTRTGHKALVSVTPNTASLSPLFNGTLGGGTRVKIAEDNVTVALFSKKLRGRRVDVRHGFIGIEGSVGAFSGVVEDFSFTKGVYDVTLGDPFSLIGSSVPAALAGAEWALAIAYTVGDVVIHGATSYTCILDHTSTGGSEPGAIGTWTTYWVAGDTVWASVDYTAATNGGFDWHAADVLIDLLTNQLNIPAEKLDLASITDAKAALPTRTVSRRLTKPTPAKELIGELAWVMGAQFIERQGLFSIAMEPAANAPVVGEIRPSDVLTLKYRRGWKELFNQGIFITGYTGDGDGADKFTRGEVRADVDSQNAYGVVVQKDWRDKWGVPPAELQARLAELLARYSDGREVVSVSVAMALLEYEPGDVMNISSGQLPKTVQGPIKTMIIGKRINGSKQTINLDLLGV